ncbi:MAG TPA: 4-hydroxyphenylacetate 3-hydroxylase N-terminal domain-containing protein [Solirubrobacteraceae bacterium]|nr:4-hydroxyphenylacetate 3-hydroxylase N-terminal domain-containing protein [Solirubrobacteraceae bacterium]
MDATTVELGSESERMADRDDACLRTGASYKEALRDGRAVWAAGERVADVTENPVLGPGIDLIAETFDAQFEPDLRGITTYVNDQGERVSRSWQVPHEQADFAARRELIRYTTYKTAGSFGRPPDFAPLIALGLLARKPMFADSKPLIGAGDANFADNIDRYIEYGQRHNIIAAEVLADPQADRSAGSSASAGLLRITSHDQHGVRLRGAKSVASIGAQADEIIFTNLLRPDFPPEACVWGAIPVATEGLKLVCREAVSHPGADRFDHPLASRGEEADQLLIFDDVFVPNERLFNVGDPNLLKLYGPVTVWAHWHILCRLWFKAELFVGVGQLVVDTLGTGGFPQVRAYMADLIQYAQQLKACVLAAEGLAAVSEGGVLAPDVNMLTAGRLFSIEEYPRIIHTIQELCGQGLVMRFTRADFDDAEIGPLLNELLPGKGLNAADKNRLMNFVWDLTTDSHAGRTELFENVNATPANFLRDRLYREYGREGAMRTAREIAGI